MSEERLGRAILEPHQLLENQNAPSSSHSNFSLILGASLGALVSPKNLSKTNEKSVFLLLEASWCPRKASKTNDKSTFLLAVPSRTPQKPYKTDENSTFLLLVPTWFHLVPTWSPLGPLKVVLGCLEGALEASWGRLGVS